MPGPDALDTYALLAAIGGLHLDPRNLQQFIDLKIAAGIAAATQPSAGQSVTPARLTKFLSEPPVHRPVPIQMPNNLTGSLIYLDESYTVLLGSEEDTDWLISRVLEASESVDEENLKECVRPLAQAVLRILDILAERAELRRNMEGVIRPMKTALVPGYGRLRTTASMVCLDPDELQAVAGEEWQAILAPLIAELPVPPVDSEGERRHLSTGLLRRPLVQKPDGGLVVALPCDLVIALRHAVVLTAIDLGQGDELCEAFNELGQIHALHALGELGMLFVEVAPEAQLPCEGQSFVLPIDTDKVVHLLVVGEDIDSYDASNPLAERAMPTRDELDTYFGAVEQALITPEEGPNGVLHLVVAHTMGRPYNLIVNQPGPPLFSGRLVFSCAELVVLTRIAEPDIILLWRFAQAIGTLRDEVALEPISQLDEFAAWRAADYSFMELVTRAMEAGQRIVTLLPGSGASLRHEIAQRFDPHGVRGPRGSIVEVERLLGEASISLEAYRGRLVPPDLRVANFGDNGVWVQIGNPDNDSRRWEDQRRWSELFAYWLWRLRDGLEPLATTLEAGAGPAVITVYLRESEEPAEDQLDPPWSVTTAGRGHVSVELMLEETRDLFSTPDNRPEQQLIAATIATLADSVDCEAIDAERARVLTEERMEPQVRKLVFTRHADPAMRPIASPRRLVSKGEFDVVMHEVGAEVAETLELHIGEVPAAKVHSALNTAVAALFARLESMVLTLSGERLMTWLVGANEALVRDGVTNSLELSSQQECYGTEIEVVQNRAEHIGELSIASVSSRFLIEYASARPPAGLRPISYSVYDRLLAICHAIISCGYLSDLLKYELGEVEAFLTPTGRLLSRSSSLAAANRIFSGRVAAGDVERSALQLEQLLDPADDLTADDEFDTLINPAFEQEYGFSLEHGVVGLYALCDIGRDDEWPTSISRAEAETAIVSSVGCDEAEAAKLIDTFSLTPRENFFPPPEPFAREELYPWRYNRQLSYVRRPLILKDAHLVYGPAAVFRSIEYLVDLISDGRLSGQSAELKEAVSKIQGTRAQDFNERVGELFEELPDIIVRRRVKKLGGHTIERARGQALGDIDVLLLDSSSRTILAIEAKALAVALTPHQLRNEIKETFAPEDSALSRHQERCAWLREHIGAVLKDSSIGGDPADWTVQGLICVDEDVLSPLMVSVSLPVRSWQQLQAAHREGSLF